MNRLHASEARTHWILTLVGAIGIPALFLPFTYNGSPADAIFDKEWWQLALPGFLSPVIVAGSVRWIVFGSFSPLERTIAYVLSAGSAAVTLSPYFYRYDWPSGVKDWLALASPPAILGLAAYFLIRNWRAEPSKAFKPVMAMQMAYLANALMCLLGFWGYWQVGAYCISVVAIMFVLQISLILKRDHAAFSTAPF